MNKHEVCDKQSALRLHFTASAVSHGGGSVILCAWFYLVYL